MVRQYVLTQDLRRVLGLWAAQAPDVLPELPPPNVFDDLHDRLVAELRALWYRVHGDAVAVISHRWGDFSALVQQTVEYFGAVDATISLDRVYVPAATVYIECNRINGRDGEKFPALGDGPRPGFASLSVQVTAAAAQLRARNAHRVLLVDEGIFSGNSVGSVATRLLRERFDVVGIAVGFHRRQSGVGFPVPLAAGVSLPEEECLDWICERDFFPGVPLAGRTLGSLVDGEAVPHPENVGLAYLEGFGDLQGWASIPAAEGRAFTRHCLHLTIEAFEALEAARGGAPLRVCELHRKVHDLLGNPQERYVDCLRARLQALAGP